MDLYFQRHDGMARWVDSSRVRCDTNLLLDSASMHCSRVPGLLRHPTAASTGAQTCCPAGRHLPRHPGFHGSHSPIHIATRFVAFPAQAVTCDDFLAAMADANSEDLSSLAKCAVFC